MEQKDKSVSMGFGVAMMSLFAFIPSPILFGYLIGKSVSVYTEEYFSMFETSENPIHKIN